MPECDTVCGVLFRRVRASYILVLRHKIVRFLISEATNFVTFTSKGITAFALVAKIFRITLSLSGSSTCISSNSPRTPYFLFKYSRVARAQSVYVMRLRNRLRTLSLKRTFVGISGIHKNTIRTFLCQHMITSNVPPHQHPCCCSGRQLSRSSHSVSYNL